ncbi:MAG TPA: M20/M25/M40 family metallo-hydrolase, partial [Thermoanaerobaculia bacterium]|nr:M20/M25/M40 family metallo-hydrolase [Thermoanaerobaculia bacterium]
MKRSTVALLLIALPFPASVLTPASVSASPGPVPVDPREVHLAELRQLTFGGENAEAYWSPDGTQLVFQSTRPPYACDQIFRVPAAGGASPEASPVRVSTGQGRTTCPYFTADGRRILFSSTHHAASACPPPPDRSQGYVWPLDPSYEIWSAEPDGSGLARLTDNDAYDAETTVCPLDGSLLFTSTRDGDLELYRARADGGEVRRLTHAPGYDGGAFFSPDCAKIVWRASRPKEGEELDDYRRLLARGLVRPSRLEIWVADADGGNARQVTSLGAASFAPSFFPSGDRIIFSSNHGDPKGREFDLWAVNVDGTGLERITHTPGFDGFPLFSPDGTRLAFSSNRVQAAEGETNVFVARWAEGSSNAKSAASGPERYTRYENEVRWLADDARGGRGVGTPGLAEAERWLVERFREIGLEPGGDPPGPQGPQGRGGPYVHGFDVPVSVEVKPGTRVAVDGKPLAAEDFQPTAFSSSGTVEGEVVAAGYGITAPELGVDDYAGIDAKGKIVVVRRFVPAGGSGLPFAQREAERRYSELRYKAWNAREHGAVALLVVDLPERAGDPPREAAFPTLAGTTEGDAGIPVVVLGRSVGAPLFAGGHRVSLTVDLARRLEPAGNVVGVLRAGAADRLPGAVLVGAHYDHLGMGGHGSLAPGVTETHNGADDNASGTAALLEVARQLAAKRSELRRDVWFVAFSGEEMGVLGSTAFTRRLSNGAGGASGALKMTDLVAMLNMDMVGRLRESRLTVFGTDSAEEWGGLVTSLCQEAGLACTQTGDGYGPSDHSPFYGAGVPVLHFFTGTHDDYHRPSDDADKVSAEGGVRVAGLVARVAEELAGRPARLTYKNAPAPGPRGDMRPTGASLGLVPDYAGGGEPGVLISGMRPGSPA